MYQSINLGTDTQGNPIEIDADRHLHIAGPTGSGKTNTLQHCLNQHLDQGAHIHLLDTKVQGREFSPSSNMMVYPHLPAALDAMDELLRKQHQTRQVFVFSTLLSDFTPEASYSSKLLCDAAQLLLAQMLRTGRAKNVVVLTSAQQYRGDLDYPQRNLAAKIMLGRASKSERERFFGQSVPDPNLLPVPAGRGIFKDFGPAEEIQVPLAPIVPERPLTT